MAYDPTIYLGAASHYRLGRPAYSPQLEAVLTRELDLDGSGRLLDGGCGCVADHPQVSQPLVATRPGPGHRRIENCGAHRFRIRSSLQILDPIVAHLVGCNRQHDRRPEVNGRTGEDEEKIEAEPQFQPEIAAYRHFVEPGEVPPACSQVRKREHEHGTNSDRHPTQCCAHRTMRVSDQRQRDDAGCISERTLRDQNENVRPARVIVSQ